MQTVFCETLARSEIVQIDEGKFARFGGICERLVVLLKLDIVGRWIGERRT